MRLRFRRHLFHGGQGGPGWLLNPPKRRQRRSAGVDVWYTVPMWVKRASGFVCAFLSMHTLRLAERGNSHTVWLIPILEGKPKGQTSNLFKGLQDWRKRRPSFEGFCSKETPMHTPHSRAASFRILFRAGPEAPACGRSPVERNRPDFDSGRTSGPKKVQGESHPCHI